MDSWMLLRNVEHNGERNRTLYVLKSRGMSHSNQVREFVISGDGIELVKVYLGSGLVLTGTARLTQEAQERAAASLRQQDHERRLHELSAKRKMLEAQIAALKIEVDATAAEADVAIAQQAMITEIAQFDEQVMERYRNVTTIQAKLAGTSSRSK